MQLEGGPKGLRADIGSLKDSELTDIWLPKKISDNNIFIRPLDNLIIIFYGTAHKSQENLHHFDFVLYSRSVRDWQ
jgi:hypothetical protein